MVARLLQMLTLRRLSAVVMLPMLLVGGLSHAGYSLFTCQYDRVARRACCCPKAERKAAPAGPTLQATCCCDYEHVAATMASAAARLESSRELPVAGSSGALEVPTGVGFAAFSTPLRPVPFLAPTGPPLILVTRSLLI
jgi:hypothetical protein